MKYTTIALALLAGLVTGAAALADGSREEIKTAVESLIGSPLPEEAVVQTSTSGLYVVHIQGTVYHAVKKGDVLLVGEAFDLVRRVSLNDEINNRSISKAVTGMPPDEMVIFAAADKKRHVTVFTDIDCMYCRRFHQEVPVLNAAGLEVRYVAYPRAGIDTASYDKIVTVWCSEDQQLAMTQAKAGKVLDGLTCPNPVADQYQTGAAGGVQGTPTLVLDDGEVIVGYMPAEQLLSRIGLPGN